MTGDGERGAVSGMSVMPDTPPGRSGPRPAGAGRQATEHDTLGYRGPSACAAAGITYRQLDYWARTGLVEPTLRPAHGGVGQRLYGFHDVLVLKIVKRLLDAGISLQSVRAAVRGVRGADPGGLSGSTLLSDGAEVYRCTSPDEVAELLRDGRGVFGIAVSAVWRDVEADLARLQAERVATGETVPAEHPEDELARRRNRAVT